MVCSLHLMEMCNYNKNGNQVWNMCGFKNTIPKESTNIHNLETPNPLLVVYSLNPYHPNRFSRGPQVVPGMK